MEEANQHPERPAFQLDTTTSSVLHLVFAGRVLDSGERPTSLPALLSVPALTYGSMFLLGVLGPGSVLSSSSIVRLPFLLDLNVAFMFLISLPVLVWLASSDDRVLNRALKKVQQDEVLTIPESGRQHLETWDGRFRSVNQAAGWVGLFVGAAIAALNLVTYRDPNVGYWMSDGAGRLLPIAYPYLASLAFFYGVVSVYTVRSVAVIVFVYDLVRHSRLAMLPAHPDRCGGLRPMGELGLRNQYALSALGVNFVLLVGVSFAYLAVPESLIGLIVAAAASYLVLAPLGFLGPLLPFRSEMLNRKATLMSEVARRLRRELASFRSKLRSGDISEEDEKTIDRIRKIGTIIEELPVWPFDIGTLRRFVTAFLLPFLGGVVYPVLRSAIEAFIGLA